MGEQTKRAHTLVAYQMGVGWQSARMTEDDANSEAMKRTANKASLILVLDSTGKTVSVCYQGARYVPAGDA